MKIRFYCIDTPEMQQKPWGIRSRDHLRDLIANAGTISIREITKDRYQRTVAELINERGDSINLRMVEDGMSAVYGKYCPVAGFKTAEAVAKSLYRGLWSQPGLHQTPWKWRELKRNRNR